MSKDKRGFGERSSNRPQAAQEASPPPRREHETYEVSIEGKGRWGCIHVLPKASIDLVLIGVSPHLRRLIGYASLWHMHPASLGGPGAGGLLISGKPMKSKMLSVTSETMFYPTNPSPTRRLTSRFTAPGTITLKP